MKKIGILLTSKKEFPKTVDFLSSFSLVDILVIDRGLLCSFYTAFSYSFSSYLGLIHIGSCGIFPPQKKLLEIYQVSSFFLPPMPYYILPSWQENSWRTHFFYDFSLPRGVAFSRWGISISSSYLEKISSSYPLLENMEVLGISYRAYREKIPFLSLLISTNYFHEKAREEYRKNAPLAYSTFLSFFQRVFPSFLKKFKEDS